MSVVGLDQLWCRVASTNPGKASVLVLSQRGSCLLMNQEPESEVARVFGRFLEEYVASKFWSEIDGASDRPISAKSGQSAVDISEERISISNFLATHCTCGQDCQDMFSEAELLQARDEFRSLSKNERNSFILAQLRSFQTISDEARSSRSTGERKRQKFDYRINSNRHVCRDVFLFYYGETSWRFKNLQKHLREVGITPPIHGNIGRIPHHACTNQDKLDIERFIVNFAATHGMPDPGRDLRKGKGRLRILLPSVLNYRSIHRAYMKSSYGRPAKQVEYHTFIRVWKETVPHICFSKPRSDLCMTCEEFKKSLNQIASNLDEDRESDKIRLHQKAIAHLEYARAERDHYRDCIKLSASSYSKLDASQRVTPCQPNSRPITMHYSWDFAQQLHYPYEDQQVGPIYFKTPRRAQLFGICCEGIPRQVNYLIDEADFLEKNSNTVISLLDHFLANHGMGEKRVFFTADNCVGQNKNNAVLHYLIYRTLMGLHDNINLSFMAVGHTKFAPDGYFGLIKHRYRRSCTYTYDQLARVIEESSENGHNLCQRYLDKNGNERFQYSDWSHWLSEYFCRLPGIKKFHHFSINRKRPGIVVAKETVAGPEIEFKLLKSEFPYDHNKHPPVPRRIEPSGLSAERSWYLYDQIREHIPLAEDKDTTCPQPSVRKPKKQR